MKTISGKTGNKLLQGIFDVNIHERSKVLNLFLHHFFQGFGLALVFIIANSLFLSQYKIQELPYVYVLSGFLILFTGRIYAWLEHHISIEKLLKGVTVSLLILLLLLWSGSLFLSKLYYAFLLLAFYQLIYLLSSLEFWGLSALVFDVRQGKRLFGLISAGDIPAKMIGYSIVSIFAVYFDPHHLILLSVASIGISLIFLFKILKSQDLKEGKSRDFFEHYQKISMGKNPLAYLKGFFRNRIIILAAILSLIAIVTLALINYSFLSEVKYKFKTNSELASFFGLFFAAGQLITIILKFFLSGRVIRFLGIKRGLMLLPLSILIILGFSWIPSLISKEYMSLIYLFGFLMLITDIIKYAIQQPVFLSIFQPLNAHLRLHGHTVIKGFSDGISYILAGILMLAIIQFSPGKDLIYFAIPIFLLSIIWLIWVGKLNKGYVSLLGQAIKTRRLTGSELQVDDQIILDKIIEKTDDGHPWEVIYGLNILQAQNPQMFYKLINRDFENRSPEVQKWILPHLNEEQIRIFSNNFLKNGEHLSEEPAKYILLDSICRFDQNAPEWAEQVLNSEDQFCTQYAITGLLQGKTIEGMVLAGNKLIELKNSDSIQDKILTCKIIEEMKLANFHKILAIYLEENNASLFKAAAIASGKTKHPDLFTILISQFRDYKNKSWYLNVLSEFKQEIHTYFLLAIEQNPSWDEIESILFTLRNMNNIDSRKLLMHKSVFSQVDHRANALKILCDHLAVEPGKEEVVFLESWLHKEIDYLKNTLRKIRVRDLSITIKNTLQREKEDCQLRIFNLTQLLFPFLKIQESKAAFFSPYKNKKANALETLESVLPKKISSVIINAFESRENESSEQYNFDDLLHRIEKDGHLFFNDWTIASALREKAVGKPESMSHPIFSNWANDQKMIIRQIVMESSDLSKNQTMNQANEIELLEIEKVSILKSTSLFMDTPENLLVNLAEIMENHHLSKGETLFNEGDQGDRMYIVYSGKIEVSNKSKKLAEFSKLDFFGELSLLDDQARSASAKATETSLLLSIGQEDFYELISFRVEVAKSVLKVLSQRLRKQNIS